MSWLREFIKNKYPTNYEEIFDMSHHFVSTERDQLKTDDLYEEMVLLNSNLDSFNSMLIGSGRIYNVVNDLYDENNPDKRFDFYFAKRDLDFAYRNGKQVRYHSLLVKDGMESLFVGKSKEEILEIIKDYVKESIDFILKNGEVININIFVLILSYSRFRIYRLSLDKTQDILFSFLNESFEAFGGVPKELLTDNMKTVMDEPRTKYSKGKINNKFQQFANDYGFKVCPCVAGRPNTKAKVEAPMKLLDEIRAYNGTLDFEELHELVTKLNNRINSSCHTSTGKIPILHLENEKDFLLDLPKEQIRNQYTITTTSVKVNCQSMISYKSNQYSVPPKYIGKRLKLQVYDNQLHVYYNTNLVTIHDIKNQKLNYHEDHYLAVTKATFNADKCDIATMAKNNLNMIGEMYQNE